MWYENDVNKEELDYSKPIVAEHPYRPTKFLLMPVKVEGRDYTIVGYDWFNLDNGDWNSTIGWKDPKVAVAHYKSSGYDIFNVKLQFERV